MTFADRSSYPDRGLGLLCSLAIHAALGLALFVWPAAGPNGKRAGTKGGEAVLIVELLPLPESGTDRLEDKSSTGPMAAEPPGRAPSAEGRPPQAAGRDHPPAAQAPRGARDSREASASGAAEPVGGALQIRSGADAQPFRALLLRHIERFRRYPDEAREAGLEGTARIHFLMNHQGQILDIWIEMSSGSRLLDEEAIAAVLRARPLPPPPSNWPSPIGVTLPIGYELK
ncbi:TonB family protein [Sandaracinobacter sp. RS1-74]|uniref:TonB family protein n=1 Tax=Sandaracinobacteroides sayramensis TaxID=2913411 RepID=UPI001EDBACA2|nr:TonB family protein [Sandaracinobacteroides sayramensis]MCG2841372.1 TonB family protein [Sandaracinobacteroides sayramensis]